MCESKTMQINDDDDDDDDDENVTNVGKILSFFRAAVQN